VTSAARALGWGLAAIGAAVLGAALGGRRRPPATSSPTYPGALAFRQARFWTSAPSRRVKRIVVHITAGQADYRRTVEYFATMPDGRQASAHYVVGRGGEVVECVRPDSQEAWHARGANADSVGIEHNARQPGWPTASDPGLPVTPAQYKATAELCRWLCSRYALPFNRETVIGHNEADPSTTHSKCPTGAWSWDVFAQIAAPLGFSRWDGRVS